MFSWALKGAATDPKHAGGVHPVWFWVNAQVLTFMLLLLWIVPLRDDSLRVDGGAKLVEMEWVGQLVLGYYAILLGSRLYLMGTRELYNQLWACNIGMMLSIVGILTHRRLLVGVACAIVLPDQPLWYADMLFKIFTGHFKIGVAKYLDWPETPMIQKITAWHHLWFLPLLVYYLRATGGMPEGSLILSYGAVYLALAWCRLFAPDDLNVNMAARVWKDIDQPFLKKINDSPFFVYIPIFGAVFNLYTTLSWQLLMYFF